MLFQIKASVQNTVGGFSLKKPRLLSFLNVVRGTIGKIIIPFHSPFFFSLFISLIDRFVHSFVLIAGSRLVRCPKKKGACRLGWYSCIAQGLP